MNRRPTFDIDPDIRQASTLPAWAYSDPAMFEAMRERVFVPSWQFVADTDQVKVPGQVHPFGLLDGLLNEPLPLSRPAIHSGW